MDMHMCKIWQHRKKSILDRKTFFIRADKCMPKIETDAEIARIYRRDNSRKLTRIDSIGSLVRSLLEYIFDSYDHTSDLGIFRNSGQPVDFLCPICLYCGTVFGSRFFCHPGAMRVALPASMIDDYARTNLGSKIDSRLKRRCVYFRLKRICQIQRIRRMHRIRKRKFPENLLQHRKVQHRHIPIDNAIHTMNRNFDI